MKYLKVIVGIMLIPLGGGTGAVLGGILGVILCCVLFWSSWPHLPGSTSLEELYQDYSDKKKQEIDNTVRRMQEVQIEDDLRSRGIYRRL